MLEYLDAIDKSVFLFINMTLANSVTDLLMPAITSDYLLRVVYGLLMALILWRGDARLRWLVLFSALTVAAADQLNSAYLKHLFERPRPCHVMVDINLLVGCGSGFSMPSSHAANSMGQAFLFSLCVPRLRYHLYVLAAIVAISRVFVGVHYPGDVLVGSIVGAGCGILLAMLFRKFEKHVLKKGDVSAVNSPRDGTGDQ